MYQHCARITLNQRCATSADRSGIEVDSYSSCDWRPGSWGGCDCPHGNRRPVEGRYSGMLSHGALHRFCCVSKYLSSIVMGVVFASKFHKAAKRLSSWSPGVTKYKVHNCRRLIYCKNLFLPAIVN